MPKHLTADDEFDDPLRIMTGKIQEPVIDVMAAKAGMGLAAVASTGSYADLTGTPAIPAAQVQADWNEASSGAADFVKNKPAARSFAAASRTLNSSFQVSATRDASVSYSVDIAATLSLVTGQTGTAYLRYADDPAHTANVKEVQRTTNGNGGALTVGLNLTQTVTASLSGIVPAGKYARIVTQNNTGTPAFTLQSSWESLL